MSVTKLALMSAMIAATLGTSARADAILTLGVFSSNTSPADQWTPTVATAGPAAVPVAQSASFAPTYAAPQSSPSPTYDGFINLGSGPFPNADSLTAGNAQPWYDSSKVAGLFGGQPTAQQVSAFDATVLQRVQQTFQLGGVPVSLTDDPTASAAHTLSVVSNTYSPAIPNAIGMTDIGGNGFHFIDNAAPYAKSVDDLEWIVAHNVAHELMLAFGVPEVHDQTGQYIDSTVGSLSLFLNPSSTFSPGAIQDLLSRNFLQADGSGLSLQAQLIGGGAPVPEPTTLAAWGLVALGLFAARRARSRRASA